MKEYYLDVVIDKEIATYLLICTLEEVLNSVEPSGYLDTYPANPDSTVMLNFSIVAENHSQVQVARNAIEDFFTKEGIDCTYMSTTFVVDLTS